MPESPLSLMYVGTLPPHQGGSAMFSGQLLPALAKRGHRIEAISAIATAADRSPDSFATDHPELTVTRYEVPYGITATDVPPPSDYRDHERAMITELVERALGRGQPDALIAGREAIVPHLEQIAAAAEVPRMLVIHGVTIRGIASGTYPRELAEPLLASMRGFDVIVTSGRHAQESMAELGVPGVRVIPNPVDVERFRPLAPDPVTQGELRIDPQDVVVLHASKLTEQKRPMDILSAADAALARDGRLLFVVAGEGRLREQMQRECASRGLAERFRFPGWIVHDRMPALISVADMVLMPSAYECQALVYLEAMACARPLIASDIPASRELVEHGVNGLMHPVGDTERLAELIIACANDRLLVKRLTDRALRTAAEHSLSRITDVYERTLTELARG